VFLLYDRDGKFLAGDRTRIWRAAEPDVKSEWLVRNLDVLRGSVVTDQRHTLVTKAEKQRLQSNKGVIAFLEEGMQIDPAKAAFELVKQDDASCRAFPEASLDAEVSPEFHTPRDPSKPVVGFADFHTHLAFPKALGALAMASDVFHRYGIEKALDDCVDLHGKNGVLDLLESQNGRGGSGHATKGYPDFTYWPNKGTNTHTQAYYRWIQRAYLSGMRVLVTDVTGNPTFCQLLGMLHLGKLQGNCKSDADVKMQVDYIYALQDYIDAQEGGPGKGWFRVAKSPAEARHFISENKLAVVLGSEYGTLFDCREGAAFCTPEYVERKLNELHAMGVRSVFPIHRFDNAFGGTKAAGGSSGGWMHLSSKMNTGHIVHISDLARPDKLLFKEVGGHFWNMEACPPGVRGDGVTNMREFISKDLGFLRNAMASIPTFGSYAVKFLDYAFLKKLEPVPEYAEFQNGTPACNTRGLEPPGVFLLNRLMDLGMIIEIDHLSYNTLIPTLELLEQRQYSGFVSSHGWLENTREIRDRIWRLGGLMSPFNSRPSSFASTAQNYASEMAAYRFPVGIGIGSDIQGVTSQSDGDPDVTITYPFTSVDGMVTFRQPKTGNRAFDYSREGVAHYGLYAEWVENLRQVDARDKGKAMELFMNSAETYLQMWERAEAGRVVR
jgi:hypothetical protein